MARAAVVFTVLISSPSDVAAECATVTSAIYDWNSTHSRNAGIVLEPVRWQSHAFPESGDRPQALINKQIVNGADMVIAIFGHRIGTPTGNAKSGTIEEIERLRADGKHVAVYFSEAPIPHDHDQEQLRLLREYKDKLKENTLYWTFADATELYRCVTQHLARSISSLYQQLRASSTIALLASQLPGLMDGPAIIKEAAAVATPKGNTSSAGPIVFTLEHEIVAQFPDGPIMELRGNKQFEITQLEYLDENGVRVASETKSDVGFDVKMQIDHAKLVQINNLKPRTGFTSIPMQFRINLIVDGRERLKRIIPVLLQPEFKPVNGVTTYCMTLIG